MNVPIFENTRLALMPLWKLDHPLILGFSNLIRLCAGMPQFCFSMDFILSLNDWTDSLEGLINSFPLYLRMYCDKKLNPSLMCVTFDFS